MAVPPLIPAPPPVPSRADGSTNFSEKSDALAAYLPVMVSGLNTSVAFINDTAVDASEAIEASAAAVAASNAAQAYSAAAKASATAAESASGSIGNLALMHSVALSF